MRFIGRRNGKTCADFTADVSGISLVGYIRQFAHLFDEFYALDEANRPINLYEIHRFHLRPARWQSGPQMETMKREIKTV